MKLQYLGTAAAEGVPAIFCDCETCRMARARGGRNVRSRPQAILDDRLLLDIGPDTLWHSIAHGLDLTNIEHCLVTHIHEDHLDPHNLLMRQRGYANLSPAVKPLHLFGSEELLEFLHTREDGTINNDNSVYVHAIAPLTPTVVGNYEVTALPACHGTRQPYNYIIRSLAENKSLLYAHDTSPWDSEAVWTYLSSLRTPIALASLDCTYGDDLVDMCRHHMCFTQNRALRDRLIACGACNEGTVFISNHFSHNGRNSLYDSFSKMAQEHGFLTSYDGMVVQF